MNNRHCFHAHPPNPPFQPTREDVWLIFLPPSARAAERGRWASLKVYPAKTIQVQQLFLIYKSLDTVGKATVLGTVISLISLVIAVFPKLIIEIPSPKPPIADPSGYQRMEGKWKLIDHVNSSKIDLYIGDEHLFELWLTVDNNHVSGRAEKIFYNGKSPS